MNGANEWLGLVNLLGNVGFPVILAGYLMLQFEKRIQSLEAIIRSMRKEWRNTEALEKKVAEYKARIDAYEQEKLKASDVS
ncbi:hypothetical protein A374_19275 [Fictibacillus macauensis ZFHKF-1]|uniref:YvrJ family protein n=1 Tax=Fictibacillus macauensis ZFHKF-1 TaxID=1196324 RepID=I8UA75_9BACL|nr:YvrJ family protein [Fictibacillus macauensis]EIT83693.1 hypothetical protein A374_19275 [Fictibacillus macauensis ZFHKF-1]